MVTIHRDRNKGVRGPRVNPQYTMSVRISQSSRPVMDWILSLVGGLVTEKTRYKSHYKRQWVFATKSRSAKLLLEQMLPYLIVKREEAEHASEFQRLQGIHKNRYEVGRTGPVPRTAEELAYKEHYFLLLKKLKHI